MLGWEIQKHEPNAPWNWNIYLRFSTQFGHKKHDLSHSFMWLSKGIPPKWPSFRLRRLRIYNELPRFYVAKVHIPLSDVARTSGACLAQRSPGTLSLSRRPKTRTKTAAFFWGMMLQCSVVRSQDMAIAANSFTFFWLLVLQCAFFLKLRSADMEVVMMDKRFNDAFR